MIDFSYYYPISIWNSQVFQYAGFKIDESTIIGDAANIEFTQVCL